MLPFKEIVLHSWTNPNTIRQYTKLLHLRLGVEDTEGKMAAIHLIFLVEVGPGQFCIKIFTLYKNLKQT